VCRLCALLALTLGVVFQSRTTGCRTNRMLMSPKLGIAIAGVTCCSRVTAGVRRHDIDVTLVRPFMSCCFVM